jgi:protein TonB
MSTPALTLPLSPRRPRRRGHALSRAQLQWHAVPVSSSGVLETPARRGLPRWLLVVLAVTVIALHAAGTWYLDQFPIASDTRPKVAKLAIEFVQPPTPLPKIEPPPPPPPPKPRKERAPPPIQTSQPVASEAPVAAPAEAAAAIAPAEPAALPPPEPVKPAFGCCRTGRWRESKW